MGTAVAISGNAKLSGFYVYGLVDPRDSSLFYIGKGKGRRYAAHERRTDNPFVAERMLQLRESGHRPEAVCFKEGLTEGEAFMLERELIAANKNLCNIAPGRLASDERAKLKAIGMLRRMAPLAVWVTKEFRPSAFERAMYWRILAELAKEVLEPSPRWVEIKPDGSTVCGY